MTAGHRHRILRISHGRLLAFLLKPRYRTKDRVKAARSPYPYMVEHQPGVTVWYLSVLSILHRWVGLTVEIQPVRPEVCSYPGCAGVTVAMEFYWTGIPRPLCGEHVPRE